MAERFAGPAGRLRGRGRVRRGILIAVGVLVLLSPVFFLAAYRVAAKKALEGPGLRAEINRKPVELKIDWDEAVSTWPGFVSVKNLTIRGSDPNVQWIVILPEAEVRYALLPLLRRNFIVTSLRPKSIQFRLRQKLFPGKYTQEQIDELPPIPGFIDPPVRVDDGSTASTATRCPCSIRYMPSASMAVDLPTPGTPVMPTCIALPDSGISSSSSCCACSRWSTRVDSTSVMARGSAARLPLRTAAASSSTGCTIPRSLRSCPPDDIYFRS